MQCTVLLLVWDFRSLKYTSVVALTGGDYEAVVLPEDQELAGFVPLLSIAYQPVYVTRGTDRVSQRLKVMYSC